MLESLCGSVCGIDLVSVWLLERTDLRKQEKKKWVGRNEYKEKLKSHEPKTKTESPQAGVLPASRTQGLEWPAR